MNDIRNPEQRKKIQQLLAKGFNALSNGKFELAGDCCQELLKLEPELVQGHFLVGLVGLASKNRNIAFSAFESVVKLDRDHAAAWAQLAKLYMSQGMVNRADNALQHTRRIQPDDPIVLDLIGTTLSRMGELGLAKAFFGRAHTIQPESLVFKFNLANCLVFHGETESSELLFKEIIKVQPDNSSAHWSLSSSLKAKDQKHIKQMSKLSAKNNKNMRVKSYYQYAIGKEYEDLQQWEQAFESFSNGAAARRETVEFDEQSEIDMFEYLTEYFTEEWFNDGSPGHTDNSPIFVLGQPRSGTTLIERIITSHSQVKSAGELQQFGLAIRRLSNFNDAKRFSAEMFAAAKDLDFKKVANIYLDTSKRMRGDSPRFVDKLPQNFLMLPLILKAFPNAKIIHLVRNPMDACFSSFKQLFADAYLHSYNQEEMARHHVRYRNLMQVWRERFPNSFFDISYEETARDLEPNARALIDFLDLPWEDECLNFHQQKTAVTTASSVQVREPAHTRSIGRWRQYEQQLQPMFNTLQKHGVDASADD
ncbi:MAG: tetratricopeptide (TPR) repeat protein [Enterobacterales bacterium]|jgi:tetratricopeptide (TPR) repeat protein